MESDTQPTERAFVTNLYRRLSPAGPIRLLRYSGLHMSHKGDFI